MSTAVSFLARNRRVWQLFLLSTALLLAIAAGLFVVSTESASPDPVRFDETVETGVGGADRQYIRGNDLALPKAQVFYSQYQYIIGYRGVERAIDAFHRPKHDQQFGYPIAVYVTDFAGTGVRVTSNGYLKTETRTRWTKAQQSYYVVESAAHTQSSDTVVPFSSREEAASFTDEYGGRVLDWEQLQAYEFDIAGAEVVRDRIDEQRASADERVGDVRPLLAREEAVVVGEDAPTIQAAIDTAPANTTVRVPDGTYNETLSVDRPVTIRGDDASIRGDGEGTVIEVESDNVAVTGLNITGVGNQTDPSDDAETGDSWDETIEAGYGHGDAGITAVNATHVYVSDVQIETPANGVLLRDTEGAIVEDVVVNGTDSWEDGFMGVMLMRSPAVIQDSAFDGGRDGIYLHRSHGTVIRNNTFTRNRFGVHFMYTSDSLVADNVARNQESAGVTIMTDPSRNAVVDNEIHNASIGIVPSGSRHYIADNVVTGNRRGLMVAAGQTIYARNVVYGNELGIQASSIRPTSQVFENDVVGNERAVEAQSGPLRIWTERGVGNYWEGAVGRPGGMPDSYSPTDPIQGQYAQTNGTLTLGASPAARVITALQETTPGMRDGAIVDTAPLSEPVHPDTLAALRNESDDDTENPQAEESETNE